MYESHFGLKKRPFRALAQGNDVFIGPQAASTLAGIKKSLGSADAIVAVSGPVGGGKTTLVMKALAGMGNALATISVGRIKLGHDEVLELLLQELGVEELPPGTVQRFGLFRRILKKQADQGTRVCVIVEDTARVGLDAIAELEALTAADAGVSDGANIILMGDQGLGTLLESQELSRVRQRLRLRQVLEPLNANELRAYLKHCFRLAGGEFDAVFGADAPALIHALSGGIVRMANNVTESAMTAAAELGLKKVDADTIARIASEEYGLKSELARTLKVPEEKLAAPPPADPEPVILAPELPVAADVAAEEEEIPELIQDTLPDLEVLAPQFAPKMPEPAARAPEPPPASRTPAPRPAVKAPPPQSAAKPPAPQPQPKVRPEAARVSRTEPVPARSQAPAPEKALAKSATVPEITHSTDTGELAANSPSADVPAWDRDPTLAELRPDLEALEQALAIVDSVSQDTAPAPVVVPVPVKRPREAPNAMPEITLDREIQAKIEEAAAEIKRTEAEAAAKAKADKAAVESIDIAATGEFRMDMELPPLRRVEAPAAEAAPPAMAKKPDPAPKVPSRKDAEMQQIAANLARAKTLDDVDDKMAETLFGEEFSAIAAQVAAAAANDGHGDDDGIPELSLEETGPVKAQPRAGAPVPQAAGQSKPAPGKGRPTGPGLDEAASQRLATVRALNGKANGAAPARAGETIVLRNENGISQPPAAHDPIESIEDQFTSMTATLQALGGRSPTADDDDDEDRKGFFSRFRKS